MIKLRHSLTPAWIVASLLATLPFTTVGAEESPADISWTVVLEPGGKGVAVTGFVPKAKAADVGRWTAGMIANTPIAMVPSEKDLVLRYTAPVGQVVLSEPLKPVLNDRQFCGFGRHLLLFPELKNRTFKRFSLTIEHPDDWKLVTSLGTGAQIDADIVIDLSLNDANEPYNILAEVFTLDLGDVG